MFDFRRIRDAIDEELLEATNATIRGLNYAILAACGVLAVLLLLAAFTPSWML